MDRREKDNEGVGDQKEGDDCNGRLFIVKRDTVPSSNDG